jgi:hypothetical protein
MTNEKKAPVKKANTSTTPTKKATTNGDVVAIVSAILITKGTPQQAALENAKIIVEKAHELVG